METRVFNRRKAKIGLVLATHITSGFIGGLVFAPILKILLYIGLKQLYDKLPWNLTLLVTVPFFVVTMVIIGLKSNLSRARIELDGDVLSEYDSASRLIAQGQLDHVLAIEQIRLIMHDSYIVRFAHRNFVMIGDGFEGAKELSDFVISRSGVEPTLVGKVPIREFAEEIRSRKPIEPDQMSAYPR